MIVSALCPNSGPAACPGELSSPDPPGVKNRPIVILITDLRGFPVHLVANGLLPDVFHREASHGWRNGGIQSRWEGRIPWTVDCVSSLSSTVSSGMLRSSETPQALGPWTN